MTSSIHRVVVFLVILVALAAPVIAITPTIVPTNAPPTLPCVQERIDRCLIQTTRKKCLCSAWMKRNCQWCGNPAQCLPKGSPKTKMNNQEICADPSLLDHCEVNINTCVVELHVM